jgi:hypothetical protein
MAGCMDGWMYGWTGLCGRLDAVWECINTNSWQMLLRKQSMILEHVALRTQRGVLVRLACVLLLCVCGGGGCEL